MHASVSTITAARSTAKSNPYFLNTIALELYCVENIGNVSYCSYQNFMAQKSKDEGVGNDIYLESYDFFERNRVWKCKMMKSSE